MTMKSLLVYTLFRILLGFIMLVVLLSLPMLASGALNREAFGEGVIIEIYGAVLTLIFVIYAEKEIHKETQGEAEAARTAQEAAQMAAQFEGLQGQYAGLMAAQQAVLAELQALRGDNAALREAFQQALAAAAEGGAGAAAPPALREQEGGTTPAS